MYSPDGSSQGSASCQPPLQAGSLYDEHGEYPSVRPSASMMQDMLQHIRGRLTTSRPRPQHHQAAAAAARNMCLIGETTGRLKWVQPSGPRRPGEGVENQEQGVVSVGRTPSGGAFIKITLLAAGFIIGPSGDSVRKISVETGADIKSWTEPGSPNSPHRPARTFNLEGTEGQVACALYIISEAVERYKALCEGAFAGQVVARTQHVAGVDFSYQPPPRHLVPYAAALKAPPHANMREGVRQYVYESGSAAYASAAEVAAAMRTLATLGTSDGPEDQERNTPANIGSLTLQQLAAALGSVPSPSPSAGAPPPSRPHQAPPNTLQELQGRGSASARSHRRMPSFSFQGNNFQPQIEHQHSQGRRMPTFDGLLPDQANGAGSEGFDGPAPRLLSLSGPSLPGAATPCNSRMGTPAPRAAIGGASYPDTAPTQQYGGQACQRPPQQLASLQHLPQHVQQQFFAAGPPTSKAEDDHQTPGFWPPGVSTPGFSTPGGPLSWPRSGTITPQAGSGALTPLDPSRASSPRSRSNGDGVSLYAAATAAAAVTDPALVGTGVWLPPMAQDNPPHCRSSGASAATTTELSKTAARAASPQTPDRPVAARGPGSRLQPTSPPFCPLQVPALRSSMLPPLGSATTGPTTPSSFAISPIISPSLEELQEAAERAFNDNTVQPFSAAELAATGYVDVPEAERFTFDASSTAPWIQCCDHPILNARQSHETDLGHHHPSS